MRRLLLVALLCLTACGEASSEAPAEAASEPTVYQVRGRVLEPYAEDRLAVRHEAIPTFRGASGELEPMAEMSMRFPVAEGIDVEDLEPGDLIAFELAVDWSLRPPHSIRAFELLAADTALELAR